MLELLSHDLPDDQLATRLRPLIRRAYALVEDPRCQAGIKAVAEARLERKTFQGDEVERIVKVALRTHTLQQPRE